MINKDTGNSRLRHYIRRDISYIDKHINWGGIHGNFDADVDGDEQNADMMLMWIKMIKMLMRMTRWNYNEGWSDWLKLLGAPAVAMSPSYVHPWSTFYTTFLFNHDQRSTLHFSLWSIYPLYCCVCTVKGVLPHQQVRAQSKSSRYRTAPTLHHIEDASQTMLL